MPDFYPFIRLQYFFENKLTIVNKSGIKAKNKNVESSFAKVTSKWRCFNNITYSYQKNFPALEKENYSQV